MNTKLPPKAFCLLSGGLDSTVALAKANNEHGRNMIGISVDYGQRHIRELSAAKAVCHYYGIPHEILTIEGMPKTMLTDPTMAIPNSSYEDLPEGVSPTYVPFRNGQLLSKIAAVASMYPGDSVIYAGMHAEDAARDAYPDCNSAFIGAMAAAIFVGTYYKVRLCVPFLASKKSEIVQTGNHFSAPMWLTWSCYAGGEVHCGTCPTCRSRKQAFIDANVPDGTAYAA